MNAAKTVAGKCAGFDLGGVSLCELSHLRNAYDIMPWSWWPVIPALDAFCEKIAAELLVESAGIKEAVISAANDFSPVTRKDDCNDRD